MKRTLLYLLLSCFVLPIPLVSRAGDACMLIPVSLEERASKSSVIAEGTVISQSTFVDEVNGNIYTASVIEVYKIFKGDLAGSKMEIITEGGVYGDRMQQLTSTLSLTPGQSGVFFCQPHQLTRRSGSSYMVYSSLQGFVAYDYKTDEALDPFTRYQGIGKFYKTLEKHTHRSYIKLADNPGLEAQAETKTTVIPTITGFSPPVISAGTDAVLTISGTNFNVLQGSGFVEFANSNDGSATFVKPLATDYVSWSDIEIQVKVPTAVLTPPGCAGTGIFHVTNSDPGTGASLTPLVVNFAYTNVADPGGTGEMPDHVSDNGSGGYTFNLFTGFDASLGKAPFIRAMDNWTCATGMNWIIGPTTAVESPISDAINNVAFDNAAFPLPAGVLGRCKSYYSGCGAGSPFTWFVTELDVQFDDAASWEYGPGLPAGGESDFESVALHELGHGHQLTHVIDLGAVMHFAITTGTTARVLGPDDIVGGTFVRDRSIVANSCGPGPMSILACPLPVKLVSFTGNYLIGKGVDLQWKTAMENNNSGYRVQRSEDGSLFNTIGYVPAKAFSGEPLYYSFTDRSAVSGKWYYRLEEVEASGEVYYSPTIVITVTGKDGDFFVFNDPGGNEITLTTNGVGGADASFAIYNSSGQMTRNYTYSLSGDQFRQTIDLADLAGGIYFYSFRAGGRQYSGKLIRTR
jgi:hypothetical protein